MKLKRAQEIVAAYHTLRARYPDASRAELAALIPRRCGGDHGISVRTLNNAFSIVRAAERERVSQDLLRGSKKRKGDRRTLLQRLVREKLSQVQRGTAPRRVHVFWGPTIAVADLHLNDIDCLWGSFETAWNEAVELAAEAAQSLDAPEVGLLIAGDWVSGKGIFRGQEVRSVLGSSAWQAVVGGYVLARLSGELSHAAGVPVRVIYVSGNHDQDRQSHLDLGFLVAEEAKSFDVPVVYSPLDAVCRIGGFCLLVLHGSGYSQYRPQSPAFQNAIIRRVLDLNMGRPPEEQIRRVVHGHQHWLDVGFQIGQWGLVIDSLGGWQRNARQALARTSRPSGLIVYIPSGEGLEVVPVAADPKVMAEETASPYLEAENVQRVGRWLEEALEAKGYEL